MIIAVLADDARYNEINSSSELREWRRKEKVDELLNDTEAAVIFNLMEDAWQVDYQQIKKPVFINSVAHTLAEKNIPANVIRINGWSGFLSRTSWELAGDLTPLHQTILEAIGKKYVQLPDEPGFISARIIAMIVNEAYFTTAEKISTEAEIDTAMKWGTNYPKGPFEWKQQIGIMPIYELLHRLSINDNRYLPCADLMKESLQIL